MYSLQSVCIACCFVWAGLATGVRSLSTRSTGYARARMPAVWMKFGGHGQNFKFLPVVKGTDEDHFPRILQIAGVFPELSVADLLAPSSSPAAPAGMWTYDFSDPEGPQLGTVALPGSDVITDCVDPVALITKNTVLGVPAVEEVEMLVVIDRADTSFNSEDFFIFRTPDDRLVIQWSDEMPEGHVVMGRVAICAYPWTPAMQKKSTGFLEDE